MKAGKRPYDMTSEKKGIGEKERTEKDVRQKREWKERS